VNGGMKSRGRERPGVRMVGPDGRNIRRGRWWVEWRLADGGFEGGGGGVRPVFRFSFVWWCGME
jgi:hypothetical protein